MKMNPPSVDANSNSVVEHVNEAELNGMLNNTKGIIQLQLKIGLILDISEITIASTSVSNPTQPEPPTPPEPPTHRNHQRHHLQHLKSLMKLLLLLKVLKNF